MLQFLGDILISISNKSHCAAEVAYSAFVVSSQPPQWDPLAVAGCQHSWLAMSCFIIKISVRNRTSPVFLYNPSLFFDITLITLVRRTKILKMIEFFPWHWNTIPVRKKNAMCTALEQRWLIVSMVAQSINISMLLCEHISSGLIYPYKDPVLCKL